MHPEWVPIKPMEPTTHQYDFDVGKMAGHDFHHELETAASMGLFGSVDADRGDPRNGWDTDQFPNSFYETTLATDCGIIRAHGSARRFG